MKKQPTPARMNSWLSQWLSGERTIKGAIGCVAVLVVLLFIYGVTRPAPGAETTRSLSGTANIIHLATNQTGSTESDFSTAEIGHPAPNFQLVDLAGKTVRLSDYKGHPILLNFWATWCGPCKAEMPLINRVYEKSKGLGLVVLGINVAEDPNTVSHFLASRAITYPILLDTTGALSTNRYNITGLPTSIFIDADGVVRDIYTGGLDDGTLHKELQRIGLKSS